MDALTPAAERCATHLGAALRYLRAAVPAAKDAHDLMVKRNLAPDAPGCLPDDLQDLIGHVEETMRQIGARVPAERRAA